MKMNPQYANLSLIYLLPAPARGSETVMSTDTALKEPPVSSYRLPRTVVPEKYEVRLEPDLEKFTFNGLEIVHVLVHEATKEIVLNALDLEITRVFIESEKGQKVDGTCRLDEETQRAYLTFPQALEPGKWRLKMWFAGTLNDKLHGFYRSTYKDPSGKSKTLAVTQMEPTDARRTFPCWDEPDFKAVFKCQLVVKDTLTAISNAEIESEKRIEGGRKEVSFKDTIKMSTYLVAFVVGEFEATKPIKVDGTPIRIFAPPGKIHLSKFAEAIAAHSLSFFNKYYGIPYPGDKLELIAVPDFAFGAMENLGAVTFRENALLVDEKSASHAELERVADVVAHEIAHMWFGDLATMKWWNGIWLNEAFATFMEMLAVDAWKPQWKRWETFGVSRAVAMSTDGLLSTRPVEFPVRHPQEAEAMFDVLTYQKGGSVLRMLEQYLKDEEFRKGIALYLDKHKFANTETTDLWDAIEESTKQPVRQLMDSWIFQEGHPVVSVTASGHRVSLAQQRFFYLPEEKRSASRPVKKTLFHVPIMLRLQMKGKPVHKRVLLTEERADLTFEEPVESVVANEGGHGFYRVRYSADLMSALTRDVQSNLSAIERFNLVNDTFAATLAGIQPFSEFVAMARLFAEERDKNVWTILISALTYIERVIGTGNRRALRDFTNALLAPALESLGWEPKPGKAAGASGSRAKTGSKSEAAAGKSKTSAAKSRKSAQSLSHSEGTDETLGGGEDELTRQLRGMLIAALGVIGNNADVQSKALEMYKKYKKEPTSVDADIVPALVSVLAASGDRARYDDFVEEMRKAKTPQEEDRYMYALAQFRDKDLVKLTLEKTINGEIRTQNAPYVVRAALWNPSAREVSWAFVKNNWDTLLAKFPDKSIANMCEGITSLASDELLRDTKDFFEKHEVKVGRKTIEQHLEKLAVAVAFKQREAEALEKRW